LETKIKFANCAIDIAPTRMFTGDSQNGVGRGYPFKPPKYAETCTLPHRPAESGQIIFQQIHSQERS
jgi:hypothetical protein